jgi:hypothetical protein
MTQQFLGEYGIRRNNMGWSIEIVKSEIDKILRPWLRNSGIPYVITHPDALSQRVNITYEGNMSVEQMKDIVALFPEFVYVNFMKGKAESISEVKT